MFSRVASEIVTLRLSSGQQQDLRSRTRNWRLRIHPVGRTQPGQIPKQVVISSPERGEAFIHEVADDDLAIVNKAIQLINEERKRVDPDEILVLSRTNHLVKGISDGCQRNGIPVAYPDRNVSGVRILSAHKAKRDLKQMLLLLQTLATIYSAFLRRWRTLMFLNQRG